MRIFDYPNMKINRKKMRLTNFDYSKHGYYFITIVTYKKKQLFGEIVDSRMILGKYGKIIKSIWHKMPNLYNGLKIDEYQIMPDHFHCIILFDRTCKASVPNVIKGFKRYSTLECMKYIRNNMLPPFYKKIWQRGYWDKIINSNDSLNYMRKYIIDNPARWSFQKYDI